MAGSLHAVRFPRESAQYRTARDRLLEAEAGLRRQIEQVAALRRQLPLGGPVTEDYVFEESGPVRLSELFGKHDTLVLYSFMYGPAMKQACSSCTSILDGLDGEAPHLTQRVAFAVVAKSPIERIRAFAEQRAWRHLRLISSAQNTYNRDYHGETSDGSQVPALNVVVRRSGRIHHFYNAELLYAPSDLGQDGRHVDLMWPLWNLFDVTPDGRGTDWNPRLTYR